MYTSGNFVIYFSFGSHPQVMSLPKPSRKIRTLLGHLLDGLRTILAYCETWLRLYFRNKTFLFFKIESWNFQHLFEKEFHETSQNFKSIIHPWKLKLSEWAELVEILWGFTKFLFPKDAETFSFLSWKTKKKYS